MKATDLMIGDYLYDEFGNICVVRYLADVITLENLEGPNAGEMILGTEFEGITLTASVLYRNGFKIDGYAVLEIDKETHLEYYFPEHSLRKVWCGIDEWDNHAEKAEITFQCQCFYVHELQHALRLCGIDKEITF